MSFYTSLTGLNASTAQLGVTSNNIANVGTTGFKRSRADFGDIFATSPLQKASSVIGQGVSLKQVTQEFSQGNIQFSANSLDIAITGDGFFPLKSADGLQDIYTRNGSFFLDDSFAVVNSAGHSLTAASVDSSGKADLGNLAKLIIPRTTNGDARETSEVDLALNLPADAEVVTKAFDPTDETSYSKTTAVTVYDAGGNDYLATIYYVKTQRATPENPFNKWQTHVYIGTDKLDEFLSQAQEGGEGLYVNKYGEVAKESDIPPEKIARGVTKLFNLDDLQSPSGSSPATVSGDPLTTALTTEWKAGVGIFDKVLDFEEAVVAAGGAAGAHATVTPKVSRLTLGVPSGAGTLTLFGDVQVTLDGTESAADVAQAVKTALDASATFTANGATAAWTTPNAYVDITYGAADRDKVLQVSAGATGVTSSESVTTPFAAANADLSFYLAVDGSSVPKKIDLGYLFDPTSSVQYTGVEAAREMTNAINKAFGDERYFDITDSVDSNGVFFSLTMRDEGTTTDETVDFTFTSTTFTNGLDEVTTDELISAMQSQVDAAFAAGTHPSFENVTVGYDPVLQSFTFETSDQGKEMEVSSAIANSLAGTTATPVTVNQETGTWGKRIIPNGDLLVAKKDQRYGTVVNFDETTRTFSISSGSTGDTSSIEVLNTATYPISDTAAELFGLVASETAASTTPLRGISSEPAVLSGNAIGINLNNKFRVDSTNNTFVVTVDNVTGVVVMPEKEGYTAEEFRDTLEKRINSLSDAFGRSVSGVTVDIGSDALGNRRFEFTTGTTGNDSFLKVSGNSIWGLADLESARGTTSRWLEPSQARDENGFPLYVDRDGLETTDPGDFSEAETQDLWSPIFLDKGELTFDTSGTIASPQGAIRLQPTTIGQSGATLQFAIDLSASTQYSSPFAVLKQDQNGQPEGDLLGVDIGDDGLVSASYSNGTQKSLSKIVLANFASAQGLRQIGDSSFYTTAKSGAAEIGEAGSAGFGTLRAGATERANVDLTQELVDLITAQRNFQANAKAIETSTAMTQAIIQIRA